MNSASSWPSRRWFGIAVVALASGSAGWILGQHGHDGRDPALADVVEAHVTAAARASAARRTGGVAIQSFADGTVSVHVDHVAADWLLQQLARGGGMPDAAGLFEADDTIMVSESSCEPTDGDSGIVDIEALTRTLAEGSESERYAALTRLLEAGIDLAPELLRQTYASDPSESVRLLAFTSYVDSVSDDRTEARVALQLGLYDGSAAVQTEAQRRLAELEQYERALAETPPQGVP